MATTAVRAPAPPALNYIACVVLVGLAWGLTTPFIRAAARRRPPPPPAAHRLRAAAALLRDPRYAVPLLLNLSGSVWFFLLVGRAELSLTVPIVNTLAFLFTVLGEWYVEGKVISRETGLGVLLSLLGIALCVHSKS